ncbi:FMN-binding protein [Litorihabitans aurantiacus]|uniref:FMN-binding domain-containing protein n=1 Tax=Litorihabitans aurantiacus TaxID=1930061 RepID=A0AA37XGW4_9MICO|nr:hypothetical protein [Litorihabitans aurantiacus]GMA32677.1 hypothetical protein GCM10025875_26690 [Litorihabitans aurantiacus]
MTPAARRAVTVVASLAAVGALGACGADGSGAAPTDGVSQSGTSPEETTESEGTGATDSSPTAGGTYADGTYSATGSYVSPGGQESIEVTLTLAAGVVEDVDVVSNATNPNSVRYQGEFVDGIADEVVGVAIDDLAVDKVAGSSLTSGGFNEAVETIKGEAGA